MAYVAGLRIYPIKALDGIERDAATLTPGGTLAGDREYALFDADGEVINGKRTARVHTLDASFDPETDVLTVEEGEAGEAAGQFDLDDETGRARAADWFSERLDAAVTVRRDADLGYVDRRDAGPSVISTATIETVADWFEDLTPESVRRRVRANVEIGGVPAFWEDQFVGETAPAFVVGEDGSGDPSGVRIEGVKPCGRCVVPERDPDTGEPTADFRERFVERRRATFPDWADEDAFQHYYTLMLIGRIPERDRDGEIRVGDEVSVVESED